MRDMVRAKNRLKDVFRSRAIEVDAKIYSSKHRELWFKKLPVADRLLAEHRSHHLDAMLETYKRANAWLEAEAAKVPEVARLCSVPGIGTIGAARIVATVVTPDRFRTKRQFWSYCGFGIVTRSTSDWRRRGGNFERRDIQLTRGLNRNCQPMLKNVFKAAAICVLKIKSNPLRIAYDNTVASGTKPNLATLTVARRIAAASLAIWKKKEGSTTPASTAPNSLSQLDVEVGRRSSKRNCAGVVQAVSEGSLMRGYGHRDVDRPHGQARPLRST